MKQKELNGSLTFFLYFESKLNFSIFLVPLSKSEQSNHSYKKYWLTDKKQRKICAKFVLLSVLVTLKCSRKNLQQD